MRSVGLISTDREPSFSRKNQYSITVLLLRLGIEERARLIFTIVLRSASLDAKPEARMDNESRMCLHFPACHYFRIACFSLADHITVTDTMGPMGGADLFFVEKHYMNFLVELVLIFTGCVMSICAGYVHSYLIFCKASYF